MHQQSVLLAQRVHLFPFRTQKLSSAEPKILAWRRAGKIGHCRHTTRETWVRRLARRQCFPCILQSSYSSLAQSVEHLTVNQGVTGSSPVGGAKLKEPRLARGSFNLIPPSEPEPAILSRNSQQPVGRLTGLDRFSGLNLHLDALLVRTNWLIQGVRVSNASPIFHKRIVQRTVLLFCLLLPNPNRRYSRATVSRP